MGKKVSGRHSTPNPYLFIVGNVKKKYPRNKKYKEIQSYVIPFRSGKQILLATGSQKFQNFHNHNQSKFFQHTRNDGSIAGIRVSLQLHIQKQEREDGLLCSVEQFSDFQFPLQDMFHIQDHSVQKRIFDGVYFSKVISLHCTDYNTTIY